MRSGKLDTLITLQRPSYTVDEYGNPQYTWTDLATARAEMLQSGSQEFIRAYGASDQTVTIFRLRFIDGVTTGDRVVANEIEHDIKDITAIGRRKGLEIRCTSTGAT